MINIKNIVVTNDRQIYGLGEDNKVYLWNPSTHEWIIWG